MSADAKPKVDPDELQSRMLGVLEGYIRAVEQNPSLLLERGAMDTLVRVSDHIRKLNADLHSALDVRSLRKLSDADLDQLEKELDV